MSAHQRAFRSSFGRGPGTEAAGENKGSFTEKGRGITTMNSKKPQQEMSHDKKHAPSWIGYQSQQ